MKRIMFIGLMLMCLVGSTLGQVTWTSRTSGTANNLYNIIYSNIQYVAAGDAGTILTSPNGTTWTSRTSGTINNLDGVIYNNSQYVVTGVGGTILTSPDGIAWTSRTSGTTFQITSIAYGNNKYVAVGFSGVIRTSPDGITWTSRTSGTTNNLGSVIYGNNQFVTAGGSGTILTSSDGITWTSRTSSTTNDFYIVTYSNNLYVAVGIVGTICTSTDGITWTSRVAGTTNLIRNVTYGNSLYVAVGNAGTLLTSTDGITWISRASGKTNDLLGVTYGNNQYVIIGSSGTILTSSLPTIVSATASDNVTKVAGIDNDDYVKLAFDQAFITSPTVTASTIDTMFRLSKSHSWLSGFGSIGSAVWNTTKDTLTVTLATNVSAPTIAVGDTITYHGTKIILKGSFNPPVLPKLISAVASDGTIIQAGIDNDDYVLLTIDSSLTSPPTITPTNIDTVFKLSKSHSWRSGFNTIGSATWNPAGNMLMVTLSNTVSAPTIAVGDTITWNSNKIVITGSFGPSTSIKTPSVKIRSLSMMSKFIQIYTLQGKLVSKRKIDSENYLDSKSSLFSGLSKGTYIVKIPSDNAVVLKKILVE